MEMVVLKIKKLIELNFEERYFSNNLNF